MNLIRLKINKLWILVLSYIRLDTEAFFSFYSKYLWLFFFCLIYFFLFKTALSRSAIALDHYQIAYPLFFVSGVSLSHLVIPCVESADQTILNLKRSGIIHWFLITPTNFGEIFIANIIWKFFLGITNLMAIIFFSNILIGTPIKPFFQGSIFCTYILMSVACIGMGMALESIILLLRKGSFLCAAVYQMSIVFGGVYFPTYLLPKFMGFISQLLPITHALKIIRYALTHAGEPQPLLLFFPLLLTSFIYFGIGFFALQKSLAFTRRNGSLLKNSMD